MLASPVRLYKDQISSNIGIQVVFRELFCSWNSNLQIVLPNLVYIFKYLKMEHFGGISWMLEIFFFRSMPNHFKTCNSSSNMKMSCSSLMLICVRAVFWMDFFYYILVRDSSM